MTNIIRADLLAENLTLFWGMDKPQYGEQIGEIGVKI
jgi:hypothetical protein